jgi:uncharacterized protein (TIGR02246 family)
MNDTHFVLTAGDESAIRALVQRMMHGFNARDADEFAAPFMEDADCVVRNGLHFKGRSAIHQAHAEIFNSVYRDIQSEYTIEQIRLLRADVALVHVRGHLVFRVEGTTHEVHGRVGLVCVKEAGVWYVAAFQNTSIQHP